MMLGTMNSWIDLQHGRRPTPTGLPPETLRFRLRFVSANAGTANVVWRSAPLLAAAAITVESDEAYDVELLLIPAELPLSSSSSEATVTTGSSLGDPFAAAMLWVEGGEASEPVRRLTLYGTEIAWTHRRIAIRSERERLARIATGAIEFVRHESRLSAIETRLGERWSELEADSGKAFEADDRSLAERRRLGERFRETVAMRAELARLDPYLTGPSAHPPTAAEQLAERMRERLRVEHRVEVLAEQLELFERVYEGCGQRTSELAMTRSSNALEWVIILLLLAQTAMATVELLGRSGSGS